MPNIITCNNSSSTALPLQVKRPPQRYAICTDPEVQFVNESHHSISWCGAAAADSTKPWEAVISTMKVCSRVRFQTNLLSRSSL